MYDPNHDQKIRTSCLVILTMAVSVPLFILWPTVARIDTASEQLLECKGNAACLQSQLLATVGSVKATMGAIAKAAPEVTSSVREASRNSVAASRQTEETAKEAKQLVVLAQGTIGEVNGTLRALNHSVTLLTQDAHILVQSSDETVKTAGQALHELSELEMTLNSQIQSGAPEAKATLIAMNKLISDPSITGALRHMEGTTGNVESLTQTFDIATKGLREKIGRVKWVIKQVASMLKITLPIL